MRSYAYRILNVFARAGRLTGNPLCVFEDGGGLDGATMQALARQFNLSETTFILPSERATARVRIFTPAYEMPFAGHPTLGTAHVVRALRACGDVLTLEMKAGVIPVRAQGGRWTLAARAPKWREARESAAELAAMIGLAEADIGTPRLWVDAGTEQLVVPIASRAAVERVKPDNAAFMRLKTDDPPGKMLIFADDGDAKMTALARFFFPAGVAVLEDPATGSACANLGGWFCAVRPGTDASRVISQGESAGRPSTLYLTVERGQVFVGGDVIELGRGAIAL